MHTSKLKKFCSFKLYANLKWIVIFYYHLVSRCKIQIHAVGNLNISCECVHAGYQATRGLHTRTVKIDPHKYVISNGYVTVVYLRFIESTYFYAVKQKKL